MDYQQCDVMSLILFQFYVIHRHLYWLCQSLIFARYVSVLFLQVDSCQHVASISLPGCHGRLPRGRGCARIEGTQSLRDYVHTFWRIFFQFASEWYHNCAETVLMFLIHNIQIPICMSAVLNFILTQISLNLYPCFEFDAIFMFLHPTGSHSPQTENHEKNTRCLFWNQDPLALSFSKYIVFRYFFDGWTCFFSLTPRCATVQVTSYCMVDSNTHSREKLIILFLKFEVSRFNQCLYMYIFKQTK